VTAEAAKGAGRGAGHWAHPTALVESREVGEGTRVWAFAHVMEGARVGRNCNLGEHVFVERGAAVGDNVTLKNNVQVWEGVTIEDDVFVGPSAVFTNDRHPRSPRAEAAGARYDGKDWLEGVTVRRGASIGANATIMCGVEIGMYAMVGAGAVVTRAVPAHALAVGCPARVAGHVCRCGQTLREGDNGAQACPACARRYVWSGGDLVERD